MQLNISSLDILILGNWLFLKPGVGTCTQSLKNLDPDAEKHGTNMGLKNMSDF